jgi:hypothetical protein
MSPTYTVVCFVVSHNNMLTIPFYFLPQYHAHHSVVLSPTVPCSSFRFVVSKNTMLTILFCLSSAMIQKPVLENRVLVFIMSSRKISSLRKDNILTYFDFFVLKCVCVCVCVRVCISLFKFSLEV